MSEVQVRSPIVLPDMAILEDGPTRIRPWRRDDGSVLVAASNDSEIRRYTSVPENITDDEAVSWIDRANANAAESLAAFFIIADARTDRGMGSVGLIKVDADQYRAEIGYWLLPDYRGAGHADRALRLLMRWSIAAHFQRLQLIINLGNHASSGLAQRNGFREEGILRSYSFGRRGREDVMMYGYVVPGCEAEDQ